MITPPLFTERETESRGERTLPKAPETVGDRAGSRLCLLSREF